MRRVQTWLIDIPLEECAELLASTPIGRLAVVVGGRPEIFPVNHVYDPVSGSIVFPTKRGTKLEAALDWPWVAFEVDGIDRYGQGWSVAVVGSAEVIEDADEVARVAEERQVIWAAGPDSMWVRIVPVKVTGRRISSGVRRVSAGGY